MKMFRAKENDDKKCKEGGLAVETMEQYLYSYLNQKYGLQSLVIEWVISIVNSVHVYSYEEKDPDVIVFGRILKNECEEGFYLFQNYTKKIIQNIVKDLIVENFKYMNENDII